MPARRVAGAALVALLAPAAPAQTYSAYDFLRLDTSPRAAALAGAGDALPTDDPAVVFYNPALVDGAQAGTLGLTYLNHLADLNGGSLAYARRLAGVDAAAGVRFLGFGELQGADAEGGLTESFSASGLALSAGASVAQGARLRLGLAVTVATVGIEAERGTAVSADLGAAYRLPGELTLTAGVRHLGTALSSVGEVRDAMPLDVRLGVSKKLRYLPLRLSAVGKDLHAPGAGPPGRSTFEKVVGHVDAGAELALGSLVTLRAGFSPRTNQAFRTGEGLDLAGLGLGFGLRYRQLAFDYGYGSWSESGARHHLGLRARL